LNECYTKYLKCFTAWNVLMNCTFICMGMTVLPNECIFLRVWAQNELYSSSRVPQYWQNGQYLLPKFQTNRKLPSEVSHPFLKPSSYSHDI
jgi:hypothetical protein